MSFPRYKPIVLACLFAPVILTAQTPHHECGKAESLLHSESLEAKAWGAHLSVVCGRRDLAWEVGEELARLGPTFLAGSISDSDNFWAGHALLDALLQLRQPLGPDFLRSLVIPYPTEAAILMLRHPMANQESLFLLRSEANGIVWVAATSALVHIRAPGVAAALLNEVPFTIRVVVNDSGIAFPMGSAGDALGGNVVMKVPRGFPPVILYLLTSEPSSGDKQLLTGPNSLYIHGTTFEPGLQAVWPHPPQGFCFNCMRIGYLADLRRISFNSALGTIQRVTGVRWTNPAALRVKIAHSLQTQVFQLKRVCRSFIAAGILRASEIDHEFIIGVTLQDDRSHPTTSLPFIEPKRFRLP